MRRAELFGAKLKDVSFEQGEILVPKSKSRLVRWITLPGEILAELKARSVEILARGGRIVPYSVSSAGTVTKNIRRITGVQRFHLHQLRHTFGCRFIEADGSLAILKEIMGHGSVKSTERYARISNDIVRREVKRVHSASRIASSGNKKAVNDYALVAQVDRATVS